MITISCQNDSYTTLIKFTDTHLSRLAPGTWMDLIKYFFTQKPSFVSDLMPRKMPHVYNIHVKIFFKKCKRFHFRKLRTVMISLFSVTRTQIDKNYGYTFLALSVSIIIIILRSSIRKYYQIGIAKTLTSQLLSKRCRFFIYLRHI